MVKGAGWLRCFILPGALAQQGRTTAVQLFFSVVATTGGLVWASAQHEAPAQLFGERLTLDDGLDDRQVGWVDLAW